MAGKFVVTRTLRPPPVGTLAYVTLPRWARRMYGQPSGPPSDLATTARLRAARLAFSQQRVFPGVVRAITRSGAGLPG